MCISAFATSHICCHVIVQLFPETIFPLILVRQNLSFHPSHLLVWPVGSFSALWFWKKNSKKLNKIVVIYSREKVTMITLQIYFYFAGNKEAVYCFCYSRALWYAQICLYCKCLCGKVCSAPGYCFKHVVLG